MKFSNFEMRMFNEAHKEAKKGTYKQVKVGCVITYKHKIIGRGHNQDKTHPMQKKYNRYRNFNNTEGEFVKDYAHAETITISSISYTTGIKVDFSKVKVFVYRVCPGKQFGYGNSKPCPACMNLIKDLGIKKIYYTDDDGYNYLQLN